jgi:Cu(I)/Ag(I) efflux system membrane fusion protein
VNTDKVWGIFNVMQGQSTLIKVNQAIRFSSELDDNDFINAKVNFIETQLSATDKTNRIRVYLNNSNLKFPIGLRLQGVVETNPIQGIWVHRQALVSIGSKKVVFLKKENGFKAKEIKTGIELNDFIQVLEGLDVNEAIAENAHYLMDSESFIKTE